MDLFQHSLIMAELAQTVVILMCLILIIYFFYFYKTSLDKEHLNDFFNSLDEPLATIDSEHRIKSYNTAFKELVDLSDRHINKKKCYQVIKKCDSVCDYCKLEYAIEEHKKQTVWHISDIIKGKIHSITFYPFKVKYNSKKVAIIHVRDITEIESNRKTLLEKYSALNDTNTSLKIAQNEINIELELAKQVQQNLLPQKPPEYDSIRISHLYHPVQTVGGDIYDFISLGENKIGLFVGDVSGHGLSSAFVGTICKMSLFQHSQKKMSPVQLLYNLNNDLKSNINTMHYLTAFWGIFDRRYNILTYAKAGHPMPLIIRTDGTVERLNASGTFLGVTSDILLEQKIAFMEKGDKCVIFTDGIYEVADNSSSTKHILGYGKFEEIVKRNTTEDIYTLIESIQDDLADYTYEDDYTIVAFSVESDSDHSLFDLLPGFTTDDDISYFNFNSDADINSYKKFVIKECLKNEVDISQDELIDAINFVINNAMKKLVSKEIRLAHVIGKERVKIAITTSKNRRGIFNYFSEFEEYDFIINKFATSVTLILESSR